MKIHKKLITIVLILSVFFVSQYTTLQETQEVPTLLSMVCNREFRCQETIDEEENQQTLLFILRAILFQQLFLSFLISFFNRVKILCQKQKPILSLSIGGNSPPLVLG